MNGILNIRLDSFANDRRSQAWFSKLDSSPVFAKS